MVAGAQERIKVSGTVRDAATGETLIGATVTSGPGHGTTTNNYGFYSLEVPERSADISYSYLGYVSRSIALGPVTTDTVLNVSLVADIRRIDEVVVRAGKRSILRSNEPGQVSLNTDNLKFVPLFFGEQDIFKYLQLLPGVNSGKEGSSGLNLRGGFADQTQIVLDDVPIYNHSHAFGFVSVFSGEAVKNANLYKSYLPPRYGGRLSGLAQLTMRDGNRKEHRQSVLIGTVTAGLGLEGPLKKERGSYIFSARGFVPYFLLKGLYAIGDHGTRPYYNFYDITAKLNYDLGSASTLYASFYTGQDMFGVWTRDRSSKWESETGKPELLAETDAGLRWGNYLGSLRLATRLGSSLFMNNSVYFSHLGNTKISEYKDFRDHLHIRSDLNSTMMELGTVNTFEQTISRDFTLDYGILGYKQFFKPQKFDYINNGDNKNITYGSRDVESVSLFVEGKLLINRFLLTGGVRASYFNNDINSIYRAEPRIMATYSAPGDKIFWLSYTENNQPLFSIDNNYYTLPVDYWIPYTDRKIQHSGQVGAGSSFRLAGAVDITLELYYKRSDNLTLVYDRDDFLMENTGYDLAKGRAYSFESSLEYVRDRFGIMASYVFSDSRHKVKQGWVPFTYDTPHDAKLLLMFDAVRKRDKTHTFTVSLNYRTGLPYLLSNTIYKQPEDMRYGYDYEIIHYPRYANGRLDNFFRTDISYNMEKTKRNGTRNWQLSILNVTNHKNPYVVYRKNEKFKSMTLIPFMPSFSYKRTFK